MREKKNIWFLALIPISVVAFSVISYSSGFGSSMVTKTPDSKVALISESTTTSVAQNDPVPTTKQVKKTTTTKASTKTLAVNPNRCRGCGRCVMVDSEHFDLSGRTASVISQTNLNSSSLNNAINGCPGSAISLS